MRKCICLLLAICLSLSSIVWTSATDNESTPASSWANPAAMTVKRVGSIPPEKHVSTLFNNIDCQLLTYRMVASSEMRSGCFMPSAFGLMASGGVTIFGGTDEAIPLKPYQNGHILVPWLNSGVLIELNPVSTGGAYLSLYSSPLSAVQDQRNTFGKLIAKQLTEPPNILPTDASGRRLLINPQTLVMSEGGSWLVAETMYGDFVRINLATLDTLVFAKAYGSQGSPALLNSKVAVSENGRYIAIFNREAGQFKVYDTSNCSETICAHYDYQPYIRSKISNLRSIGRVRFVNNDLLSFEARVQSGDGAGVYQLAPRENITSMTDYVGLGDSYTSGEGAFNYLDGTDTNTNACHVSAHSYPLLITRDLFSHLGGHSVACSGAKIHDVGSTKAEYRGQVRGGAALSALQKEQPAFLESVESNFMPGYIAQHRFVKRWQPRIATISIGGNDVGFGDILQQCILPKVSRHHSDSVCFNTYEDRVEVTNLIDRTVATWTTLFAQLKSESPVTQFYVIGYPDLVDDTGSCALNVNLSKSELEFAKELVVYVNQGLGQAAQKTGLPYVDISKALVGHRLCEAKDYATAVNGLTAGDDTWVFGRESYHPNALGHQLIEQAILEETNNLAAKSTEPPVQSNTTLLDAPKTGRTIYNRQPAAFTDTLQHKGGMLRIQTAPYSLKPHTTYHVTLDGPNGRTIGTLTSTNSGEVIAAVVLPATTESGPHTIDIIGEDQTDQPMQITQPVYVAADENDYDEDALPNTSDSCPFANNSGQDEDQDGIDDTCDSIIGRPTTPEAPVAALNTSQDTDTINSTTQHRGLLQNATVVTTFKLNKDEASLQSTSEGIYHAQSVKVNNTENGSVKGASVKSHLPEEKRIGHGQVTYLSVPQRIHVFIALWLLLLLLLITKCAQGAARRSRVPTYS